MAAKSPATRDVLFEIGTEELPATNLADLFESPGENALVSRAKKAFEDKRISFKSRIDTAAAIAKYDSA